MWQFIRRVRWAVSGIRHVVQTQQNMKIHLVAAVFVTLFCLYLRMPPLQLALIFFSIFLVLSAEMFNTAIEAAVDLFTIGRHPLAKVAKDVAAGAVLLAVLNALVIAYLLIWPRLRDLVR